MQRIHIQGNKKLDRFGGERCPAARVTVILRDGTEIQKTVNAAHGNPGNPASPEDLEDKFYHCADTAGLSMGKAKELLRQIKGIGGVSSTSKWMRMEVEPLFQELISRKERNPPVKRITEEVSGRLGEDILLDPTTHENTH